MTETVSSAQRSVKRPILFLSFCLLAGAFVAWFTNDRPSEGTSRSVVLSGQESRAESRSESSTRSIPKIGASSPAQLVPGARGYDPTKFLAVVQASDIHAQEPRDDAWASAVETWLKSRVEKDLTKIVPEAKDFGFDCRSAMCQLSWTAPRDTRYRMNDALMVLFPSAGGGPGKGDRGTRGEIVLAFRGGILGDFGASDTDRLFEKILSIRASKLRMVKSPRGQDFYPQVKPHEWPEE